MALKTCRECGGEVASGAKTCPHCGKRRTMPAAMGCAVILGAALIIFFIPMIYQRHRARPLPAQSESEMMLNELRRQDGQIEGKRDAAQRGYPAADYQFSNQYYSPREDVASSVRILDWSWSKGGFGNIMKADFQMRNDSRYDIKDIVVKCTHFGKSGTEIDSNTRTIYDVIEAGETKVFQDFSMGFIHSQTDTSRPSIESCEIRE